MEQDENHTTRYAHCAGKLQAICSFNGECCNNCQFVLLMVIIQVSNARKQQWNVAILKLGRSHYCAFQPYRLCELHFNVENLAFDFESKSNPV